MHGSANGELVSVVKRAALRGEEVYLVRRSRPGSPNATISVYEAGRNDNTLAVVEISHPVMDGKDLVYDYKLIEGMMPKSGGTTALCSLTGLVRVVVLVPAFTE